MNPKTKKLTHLHINAFFSVTLKKLQEPPIIEKKDVSLQTKI